MKQDAGRKCTRVYVVDGHPVMRDGIRHLLSARKDFIVCGEGGTCEQAMAGIEKQEPDLLILDLALPGRSGFELVKDLRARHPDLPVLVFSAHDEQLFAERVIRAGGRGYLMKSEPREQLLTAIRVVLSGQVYLSPSVTTTIVGGLSLDPGAKRQTRLSVLTDREFETYQAIGQGLSTQEISRKMGVSGKTVATHRTNIKRKLKLGSTAELIRQASTWLVTQDRYR